jgi:hypothetical protein
MALNRRKGAKGIQNVFNKIIKGGTKIVAAVQKQTV